MELIQASLIVIGMVECKKMLSNLMLPVYKVFEILLERVLMESNLVILFPMANVF